MRRLARRLFRICTALSLVACVAVLVLWMRSFNGGDQIVWTPTQPSRDWQRELLFGGAPDRPPLRVIENRAVASLEGRVRLRYVGWTAMDTRSDGLFGGNPSAPAATDPSSIPPPAGVVATPGWAWAPGVAARITLWLSPAAFGQFLGFAFERGGWDEGFVGGLNSDRIWHWNAYEYAVEIPHWFLVLATAVLPAVSVRPAVLAARKRRRRGLCPSCGYDMRASPDRCPECGTPNTKVTAG